MKTAGIKPPKDDGDDHDGAFASWLMAVQQPDAQKPEAKKPEHEEDATMKVVAPFIAKCQGEMSPKNECSLAKGFDPAKECNTHVDESQKCKSCKKKLLPCVMKAMKTAGIQPPKDDGDDHDGAFASWLMAVQQPDAQKPEAKKPEHEEDATMKVVAPFIAKCQGEMSPTDKCSLAKGFDPAKECNTHVDESQKCKSCKKKLLPCVMKAMKTAGI